MSLLQIVGAVVALIVGVLALATALGALYGYFRRGLVNTTSDIWKEEAQALGAKVERLESSDAECKRELVKMKATMEGWTSMVTGAAEVLALSGRIDVHHQDIMRELAGIASAIGRREADERAPWSAERKNKP